MFALSIPIGIYSATHQYSLSDTLLSALAFLGLSIPPFLLALIWLYVGAIQPGITSCICGLRRLSWGWQARPN